MFYLYLLQGQAFEEIKFNSTFMLGSKIFEHCHLKATPLTIMNMHQHAMMLYKKSQSSGDVSTDASIAKTSKLETKETKINYLFVKENQNGTIPPAGSGWGLVIRYVQFY